MDPHRRYYKWIRVESSGSFIDLAGNLYHLSFQCSFLHQRYLSSGTLWIALRMKSKVCLFECLYRCKLGLVSGCLIVHLNAMQCAG